MGHRRNTLIVLISISSISVFIGLPAAPARPEEPGAAGRGASEDRVEVLLGRADAAARAGDIAEAVVLYRDAFAVRLPRLRGLEFHEVVQAGVLDSSETRAYMIGLFEEELPDEEIEAERKALVAFGLIPDDLDLKEFFIDLLGEEVAGFYHPQKKRLYMVAERKPRKKGWLQRLLGGSDAFDPEEARMVIAHEMTHALADQNFDLVDLESRSKHDDDLALAVQSLVEGEATIAMLAAAMEKGEDVLAIPPGLLELSMSLVSPFLPFLGGESFRKAPRIIRETLLFPYLKGMIFVLHLTRERRDWEEVNKAFRNVPLSTEQIIHPEKFSVDPPVEIRFPEISGDLGDGWVRIRKNVMGELGISILLKQHRILGAGGAARGWDGDTYHVYEGPPGGPADTPPGPPRRCGPLAIVWASTWDSDSDAEEFAGAMARLLRKKARLPAPEDGETPRRIVTERGVSLVKRTGVDVLVLDGIPVGCEDAVGKGASRIVKVPKRFTERRSL